MTETFKVGDKVHNEVFGDGEITYGPLVTASSADTYVMRGTDGQEHTVISEYTTRRPAFAVGDEATIGRSCVRIVGGPVTGYATGSLMYLFEFTDGEHAGKGDVVRANDLTALPNTYTHEGVTYDLTACYLDRDGDVWSFTGKTSRDGVPRITMFGNPDNVDTVDDIAYEYGPLTRV